MLTSRIIGLALVISKYIVAQHTLTGGDEGICIDKSTPVWVVISALEVIQTCLSVVDIATVAQRIVLTQCGCHASGGGKRFAPGIVCIGNDLRAGAVYQSNHITLMIQQIVVGVTAIYHRHRITHGIIHNCRAVRNSMSNLPRG